MVDENDAVSGEQDETEATAETVETTDNPVAQAKPKADDAEQDEQSGDDADKADDEVKAKDDKEDKSDDDKKPSRKPGAEKRIKQLIDKRNDLEREVAQLRSRLERNQKLERPDPGKYDDPDEYTSDLAVYKLRTSETSEIEEGVKHAQESANQALVQSYQEKILDFAAETPDFHSVASNPALQITPIMANEIMDSDQGPQVQYYLGKNPREAAEIATLSPAQQIRAIGRLEARVSAPVVKRVTQAPAPIKPVTGKSSPSLSYSESMSMEDYARMRAAGRNP